MGKFPHVSKHVHAGTVADVVRQNGEQLLGHIGDHVGDVLRRPGATLLAQVTISARGAPLDLLLEVRLRAATPEDLAAMDAVHAKHGGADAER